MQRSLSDWGGNLVAFAIVILFNVLSNALPINEQTMPEISAKYKWIENIISNLM